MASADNASLDAGRSQDPGASWPGSAVLTDPRELAETAYLLRKERDLWVAHFEQLLQATEHNHASLADFQRAAARISEQTASDSRRGSLAVQPLNVEPIEAPSRKKDSLEGDGDDENYVLSNPSQELIEERARNAVLQGDLRAANLHITILDAKVDSMFERLIPQQMGTDSEETPESFVIRKLNAIEEAFVEKQSELEALKKGLETATHSLQREQERLSTQRSLGESLETRVAGLDTKLAEVLEQLDQTCRQRDQLKDELLTEQKAHQTSSLRAQQLDREIKELQDQLRDASELRDQLKYKEGELEQAKTSLKLELGEREKATLEIDTLKQQNAALGATLAELRQAGKGLNEANQAFQESVSALKAEIETLRSQSASATDSSTKSAEKLQSDLSLAQDALKTASEHASELDSQLKSVTDEKVQLTDKVATLESEKAQVKVKCDGLQEELAAVKDGASKMKAEYEKCVKDLQEQIDLKPRVDVSLTASKSESEGQKPTQDTEALLKDLESLKVEADSLRGQLETTKSASEVQISTLKSSITELEGKLASSIKDVEMANLDLGQYQSASQDKIKALETKISKQAADIERLKTEKQDVQNELGAAQCQVNVLEQMLDQQKADHDTRCAELEVQMEKIKAEAGESIGKLFARIVELEQSQRQLGRTGTPSIDESDAPKPEEGEATAAPPISRLENKLSFDNMTFDKHSPDVRSIHSSKFISIDNLAHKLDQSFGQAAFEDEQDESKKFKGLTLRDAVDKIDFLKSEITRLHDVIKNLEDKMAATQLQHSSIEYGYKHEIVGLKANYSSLQEELRQSRVDKSQLLLTLSRIENPSKDLDSKKVVRLQKEIEALREQLEKAQSQAMPSAVANPETEKELERLNELQETARSRIRRMQGALQLEAISYTRILDTMREVVQQAKKMGRKLRSSDEETAESGITPVSDVPTKAAESLNKLQDSHLTFSENDQEAPEEAWSKKLCLCREELELIAADLGATLESWLNLPSESKPSPSPEELTALQTSNSGLQQELDTLRKELDRLQTEQASVVQAKPEQVEDTSTAASLAEDLARANVELAALRNANAVEFQETMKFKAAAEQLEVQLQASVAELAGLKDLQQKLEQLQAEVTKLSAKEVVWEQDKTQMEGQVAERLKELQELTTRVGLSKSENEELQKQVISLQDQISSSKQAREGSEEWNKLERLAREDDWKKEKTQLTLKLDELQATLIQERSGHDQKIIEKQRTQDAEIKILEETHAQEISRINTEWEQKLASMKEEPQHSPLERSSSQDEAIMTQPSELEAGIQKLTKELDATKAHVAKLNQELAAERNLSQLLGKQIFESEGLIKQQQTQLSKKDDLQAQLASQKALNSSLQSELSILKDAQEQKPSLKEVDQTSELQARIKQLETQLASAESALDTAKKQHLIQDSKLQQDLANKLGAALADHRTKLEDLRSQHQQDLKGLEAKHQTELVKTKTAAQKDLEAEKTKHTGELAKLQKESQLSQDHLKTKLAAELDAAKVKWEKEKQLMKKQFADDLERTEQLCSRLEATVREKERTIIELKGSLQKAQEVSVSDLGKLTVAPEELPVIEYLRSRVKAKDKLIDSIIKEVIAFEDILANDPDKDAPVEIALGILADLKKNMLDQSLEDSRAINSQMEAAVLSVGKNGRTNQPPSRRLESRENSKRTLDRQNLDSIQEEEDTKERPESERTGELPTFGYRQEQEAPDSRTRSELMTPDRTPQTPPDSRNRSPERTIKQLKDEIVLLNQKIAAMGAQRGRDRSRDSVEEERTSKPVALQRSAAPNHSTEDLRPSTPYGRYPTTPTQNKYQQSQPTKQTTKTQAAANDELEQKLVRLKGDLVKGQEKMKLALIRLEEKDQLIEESALEIQKLKRTLREMKISEKMMLKELSHDQKAGSPRSTSKSNSMTPNRSPSGTLLAQKSNFILPSGSTKRLTDPRETDPREGRGTSASRSPISKPTGTSRGQDQDVARSRSRQRDLPGVSAVTPKRDATGNSSTRDFARQPRTQYPVSRGTWTEETSAVNETGGYLTLSAPQSKDSAPLVLFSAFDALKGIHLRLVEITSRNSPEQLKTFSIEGQPALRLLRDLSKKIAEVLGVEKEQKEPELKPAPPIVVAENPKSSQLKANHHQEIVASLEELSRLASTTEELSGLYSQLDECAVLLAKALTAKQKVASVPKIKDFIKASECDRFKFRCELLVKEEKKARTDKLRPLLKQTLDSVKQQFELVRNTLNDRKSKLASIAQGAGESLDAILQSLPTK